MNAPSPIVYLNGNFLPLDKAFVSVLDRGFIFGDGVYEVIPVYGGKLFRLAQHLKRLDQSLAGIRLANPLSVAEWLNTLTDLVKRNASPPGTDQYVYFQVTRGVAKRDFAFPEDVVPTVFAMCSPLPEPAPELVETGIAAITLDDIRWQYCNIKAITLLPSVLMRQQAVDNDASEAILIRDRQVTEGAASNLFIVKDGTIQTPPHSAKLLPGVTRDLVVELANSNGITCREEILFESDLQTADEIWLTSSTKEILPVTRLDGYLVKDGTPGPVWKRMTAIFQDYKHSLRASSSTASSA
jgi:D-alanine transaminase